MKKTWILILLAVVVLLPGIAKGQIPMLYIYLEYDLKFRIGEYLPDMSGALYDSCILMAANAVRAHGLGEYGETLFKALPANTSHFVANRYTSMLLGSPLFIEALSTIPNASVSYINERGIPEIDIASVGHKTLSTDQPHSFFFHYYQQDTPYVYIYPSKPDADSIVLTFYDGYDKSLDNIVRISSKYREALLNYAAMLVWIRQNNYKRAAECYNAYRMEITQLREETVNWIPGVSIAPKILD